MSLRWTDVYDRPGPFATVLVDVSLGSEAGAHVVETMAQSIGRDLDALGAPPELVAAVRAVVATPVHEPAPRSRYVVADPDGVIVDVVLPHSTETPVVEWEPLPDPTPLLLLESQSMPFVLVTVDHEGGDVSTVGTDAHAGETDSTGRGGPDLHKFKGGGWSHQHWQHSTENLWRDNARDVADLVRARVAEGYELVVVAGSIESRRELVAALDGAAAEVVQLDRSGRSSDGGADTLREDVRDAVSAHVGERTRRLRDEVSERVGRGVAVAVGVEEVADALALGQVATLVIDPRAVSGSTLDPASHPGLDLGAGARSTVRADLALLAGASRTDSGVVVVDAGSVGGHTAVGLLRWDEDGAP